MTEPQISTELLVLYLEDARTHLEALDQCLMGLERAGYSAEDVSAVLGPLHTLKGNSGMMGFEAIKDYIHRLEDVLGHVLDRTLPASPAVCDRLLAGASGLRAAVEQAGQEGTPRHDLASEHKDLEQILEGLEKKPPAVTADAGAPRDDVRDDLSAPAAREDTDVSPYVAARSSMVRVAFDQLDHLLNLVGELILYRTKLHQAGRRAAGFLEDPGNSRDLLEAVEQLEGVSAELQDTVMDIRMLPIRHVFERFPRLVRDLSRTQGKQVELIVEGQNTRVDKAVIDEIGEPLVHMVRNSVDHGIETPAERVAQGKNPTGTILLSATQESNHILITLMDDGAGIDAEQVRRKALERGLIKSGDGLSDRETVQLIFAPGLSTARTITDVSGRGVGLDVVLQSIERLNGMVEVETVAGVGTKFVIQLPLTLAIVSALLVAVREHTYAIPLGAVAESLHYRPHDVHRIGSKPTLRVRDRIVPLLDLGAHFDLPPAPPSSRQYAVILGRGEKRLGLVVDRLLGQQEIVIKALDATITEGPAAIAGATIMGDGRVVLILDVPHLFEGHRQVGTAAAEPAPRPEA